MKKTSFRVRKKIFATLDASKLEMVLKLTVLDQDVFCSHDANIIHPVVGAWGKKGWTLVHLDRINLALFKDALTTAYISVAPKKLGQAFLPEE